MVGAKTAPLDRKQATTLVGNFLETFQNFCNKQQPLNTSELGKFLTPNFQLISNGRVVSKSLADFQNRIEKFQTRFSNVKVTPPKEWLISDNKAIIQYEENYTSTSGQTTPLNVIAIVTFEGNLITQWSQVENNRGKDFLES